MKIAFDVQNLFELQKTGIGQTVKMLVENSILDENNEFQLNYFAFRKKNEKQNYLQPYVKSNVSLQCCGWMPLALYKRIWNFLPIPYSIFMREKVDVTQFFNYFIPPGVKGKKAVFIYDMVWKACPETMDTETKKFMDRNVINASCRADIIITVSDFSKQEIQKYLSIPANKIQVVYGGVDLERFNANYQNVQIDQVKKKYGIRKDYFLYLGTLEPRKNIVKLIEAYSLFKKKNKDAPVLVIAGKKGWQYEEILQAGKRLGIEESVIFTGYIEDDEAPLLLCGAVSFVFPSIYEGFGLPVLEAMACDIPVIAADAASLPEVVGEAGLLVDPYSTESIADAMQKIWENTTLRQELCAKGRNRVKKFTWENNAKKLLAIYKNML